MGNCIDWPCCGHESGCCPDFDDSGRQLNMKCTCGATVPINNRFSICDGCLNQGNDLWDDYEREYDDDEDDDDWDEIQAKERAFGC